MDYKDSLYYNHPQSPGFTGEEYYEAKPEASEDLLEWLDEFDSIKFIYGVQFDYTIKDEYTAVLNGITPFVYEIFDQYLKDNWNADSESCLVKTNVKYRYEFTV